MGDVEWTDEAYEAVALQIDQCMPDDEPTWSKIVIRRNLLDVLTPHVEAMVREARAEALRDVASYVRARQTPPNATLGVEGRRLERRHIEEWLKDRVEEVRRGD